MIIDGKKLSEELIVNIKSDIKEYITANKMRRPKLSVILVGEDPASKIYVKHKVIQSEKVGIDSELISLSNNITEKQLLGIIEDNNNNDEVDAILVQLPLPEHISEIKVLQKINPQKDVDGFNPINVGRLNINEHTIEPCTPKGIFYIFEKYKIDIKGKDVVVIGTSNIVGKPLISKLINEGATVTACNEHTVDLGKYTSEADIVISSAGVPNLLNNNNIKNSNTIVIDVAVTRVNNKIVGDANFAELEPFVKMITPVPGGVGPLTVAMLMVNTFMLFKGKK